VTRSGHGATSSGSFPATRTSPSGKRKVVTPNDFYDLSDVADRLAAFEALYNFAARPFNWRYTRADLDATLNASPPTVPPAGRAARREAPRHRPPALARVVLDFLDGP